MAARINHQDVVKKLLDSKAVDFAAVGRAFTELGPSLAVADEPWETFCGTMRVFIRLFILGPHSGGVNVEQLAGLQAAARELNG